jgi:hypothetical protein
MMPLRRENFVPFHLGIAVPYRGYIDYEKSGMKIMDFLPMQSMGKK